MKHISSPKQSRKQAEDNIIRNMRLIQDKLDDYRARDSEPIDKDNVMGILTHYLRLKDNEKRH